MAKLLSTTTARFGISALHVESGRRLSWNAGQSFEAASVIKLALLAEAAARVSEGSLDLSERWSLTSRALAAGSGVLGDFEPGLNPSNRDLLRLMISVSDNTAANLFIDRFGHEAVNARMRRLGLSGIELVGRIPNRPPPATEETGWQGLVLGRMTPEDTAAFYAKVALGTLVDKPTSRLVARFLSTQKTLDRIPRLVLNTPGRKWAGKTGTMNGVRNDSGILTTPKGHFVLVMFANEIPETWEASSRVRSTMGEIADAIVRDWSQSLPDLPKEPDDVDPPPALASRLPRIEISPQDARPGAPLMERVFRETDRRFWELYGRVGGNVSGARLVPMPNSWWEGDQSQKIEPVSALILHHTSMETDEECLALFQKPESLVSSHFLVGRDGRLYQFVSLEHRAWHAGRSLLHGRQALNRTSIGVEITGDGNLMPYTRGQVETVVRLVGVLTAMFDVKAPWIAGHEHIAPDRKDDPGVLFPWNEIVSRALGLAAEIKAEVNGR